MMNNKLELVKVVSKVLMPIGFKREKTWWTRLNNGIGSLFDIQKSNYSGIMYVNIGFWIIDNSNSQIMRDEKCHVRFRLTSILGEDDKKRVEKAFNTEAGFDCSETEFIVRRFVVPLFSNVVDTASLVLFIEERSGRGMFLTREVQNLMKIFRN